MEPDARLLTRYHRQGDASAFQALVQAHAGMVHATAQRVTQDAALAQDVAQETFLALARSGGTAIRCVGAWLHRVAFQKALNAARGAARRQRNETAAAPYLHGTSAEVTWAHLEPLLDEALEKLSEPSRELIVQHFLEGLSQQEMARRLGVNQATVSRKVSQAVDQLRALLPAGASAAALAALLVANGSQAAPTAVMSALGKISLSGTRAAIGSSVSFTSLATVLVMKISSSKLALAATGLLMLFFGAAGYHLASPNRTLAQGGNPASPGAGKAVPAAAISPPITSSKVSAETPPPMASITAAAANQDSPQARLVKLTALNRRADFKALVLKLFSSRDPHYIAKELHRLLGITLREQSISSGLGSAANLEGTILMHLAANHPREALAWMAVVDEHDRVMNDVLLSKLLDRHPDLSAEDMAAILPQGPNRETVLAYLRAQKDPIVEIKRLITSTQSPSMLQDQLWKMANVWPKSRMEEGVTWALENLSGKDLQAFLPRLVHHLSGKAPDPALNLMRQIEDPELLQMTLIESMHGLIHEHPRMADIVTIIGRLDGAARARTISELTRRWVRVDQAGLVQWINSLESPADFEAALPLTLAQLSAENYATAMDTLMPQLDGKLDAAIIRAAAPDFSGATKTSVDIVQRFTRLPQYSTIGAGHSGNQDLLWQTVNKIADGWVVRQGAAPIDGARWIDSLPFRTAEDRSVVAARLYSQWKVNDPAAASRWAATAGVNVP
jgi:RNA polymerase sigma factor (sigma-70 family)